MDDKLKKDIITRLKKEPNALELAMLESNWSEHCGYLHSKLQLKKLHSKNALFSDENSGGVRIPHLDGDFGVFFKVESHNHPCAVEPYQGAATGIGGIIRDILALNARPVALLNSLKFAYPKDKRTKYIVQNVTKGISDYGNCVGLPNIQTEVIFDNNYKDKPLVNVMAVGVADLKDVKLSGAEPDLEIVILGSNTGLDGLYGSTFASCDYNDENNKLHIQIGNPFLKNVLIEATLEILKLDSVIACQDCGAAGILSSTSEMAYKGKCAIELDLDKVHLAKKDMSAEQILLSESQERMVFALKKEGLEDVFKIAEKYEINVSHFGRTFKGSDYIIKKDGKILSKMPLDVLCEPLLFDIENDYNYKIQNKENNEVKIPLDKALCTILSSHEFCSKHKIYEQFDYQVRGRTYFNQEMAQASVLKLFEKDCFIGFSINSTPQIAYINPYQGALHNFFDCYRSLVATGLEPVGLTNCLNFANPTKEAVQYQFTKTIDALSFASKKLDIPVVSGNVSFYNEDKLGSIYPSATFSMMGYCKNEDELLSSKFSENEDLFLINDEKIASDFAPSSLYQRVLYNHLGCDIEKIDFDKEVRTKEIIFKLRNEKLINSSLNLSSGGLLGTLVANLIKNNIGFKGDLSINDLSDNEKLKLLFAEIPCRYLVSTKDKDKIEEYLKKNKISHKYLGKCVGDKIKFNNYSFELEVLKEKYFNSLNDVV